MLSATCFFGQQSRKYGHHVHRTVEMVDFHKGSVGLDMLVSQMGEFDVLGEACRHGFDVVARAFTEGTGVESQAIRR